MSDPKSSKDLKEDSTPIKVPFKVITAHQRRKLDQRDKWEVPASRAALRQRKISREEKR